MNHYTIVGFAISFIFTACNAQFVSAPEQDLFSVQNKVKQFNESTYNPKPIQDALSLFNQSGDFENPEALRLQNELHNPESTLFNLYLCMKSMLLYRFDELSLDELKKQLQSSYVAQFADLEPLQFKLLRALFPANFFTRDEWKRVLALSEKFAYAKQGGGECDLDYVAWWLERVLPDLPEAVKQLDALLEDGDTVIGVGNTSQYVLEALKYSKKKIRLIPVALSGHPGYFKSGYIGSLGCILTEQGLMNFVNYLCQLQLTPRSNHKRIFVLDMIGSGGGPAFLIRRLLENWKDAELPEIKLIAINAMETKYYTSYGLNVPCMSLNLSSLASMLDRMPHELRVTPDFQSWRWHDWETDPTKLPVGKYAPDVIKAIKKQFENAEA